MLRESVGAVVNMYQYKATAEHIYPCTLIQKIIGSYGRCLCSEIEVRHRSRHVFIRRAIWLSYLLFKQTDYLLAYSSTYDNRPQSALR